MDSGEIIEDCASEDFFTTPKTQRARDFLSQIISH